MVHELRCQNANPDRTRVDIWSPLAAMTSLLWEEVEDWWLQLGKDRLTRQVGLKTAMDGVDRAS